METKRDLIAERQKEAKDIKLDSYDDDGDYIFLHYSSDIDKVLGQINDAFKVPYYDVYTRRQERVSKVLVAISGRFTENGLEEAAGKVWYDFRYAALRGRLL